MKKVFSLPQNTIGLITTFFLPAVVISFLLQSCCCLGRGTSVANRNCNCGGNKSQHAVNNKQINQPGAGQSISLAGGNNNWVVNPGSSAEKVTPAIQPEPVLVLKDNDHKISSGKKLPLGINGIRTTIIAGPNVSFRSSKEDYGNMNHKNKSGVGFQFGVGISYAFSDRFAVAPTLIFKQNNASEVLSYSTPGDPGGGSYNGESKSNYSYSYLSAPILAEVRINDHFTAMAGPELNLLLGAKDKSSGYSNAGNSDIKDKSVKTGLGIQAGIKYSIPGSPLGIQLLYDQRISRLNKKSSSDYSPGSSYSTPATNMGSLQVGVTCEICELLKNSRH